MSLPYATFLSDAELLSEPLSVVPHHIFAWLSLWFFGLWVADRVRLSSLLPWWLTLTFLALIAAGYAGGGLSDTPEFRDFTLAPSAPLLFALVFRLTSPRPTWLKSASIAALWVFHVTLLLAGLTGSDYITNEGPNPLAAFVVFDMLFKFCVPVLHMMEQARIGIGTEWAIGVFHLIDRFGLLLIPAVGILSLGMAHVLLSLWPRGPSSISTSPLRTTTGILVFIVMLILLVRPEEPLHDLCSRSLAALVTFIGVRAILPRSRFVPTLAALFLVAISAALSLAPWAFGEFVEQVGYATDISYPGMPGLLTLMVSIFMAPILVRLGSSPQRTVMVLSAGLFISGLFMQDGSDMQARIGPTVSLSLAAPFYYGMQASLRHLGRTWRMIFVSVTVVIVMIQPGFGLVLAVMGWLDEILHFSRLVSKGGDAVPRLRVPQGAIVAGLSLMMLATLVYGLAGPVLIESTPAEYGAGAGRMDRALELAPPDPSMHPFEQARAGCRRNGRRLASVAELSHDCRDAPASEDHTIVLTGERTPGGLPVLGGSAFVSTQWSSSGGRCPRLYIVPSMDLLERLIDLRKAEASVVYYCIDR